MTLERRIKEVTDRVYARANEFLKFPPEGLERTTVENSHGLGRLEPMESACLRHAAREVCGTRIGYRIADQVGKPMPLFVVTEFRS